ncbi:plasmid recombination protein [Sporocytophaga myxococcoides]|uniref:Plasmid recombination protein n=1 Tax=Sporocytophaga myxococcoides TaxID=153721 RepID=A0A098LMS0_9BACT|nr:plasmid recombination protein [Sporocytophaga myxococcoides]
MSSGKAGADVWIEQGGEGKRGAINLLMHLDSLTYKDAVRLLAEHFDNSAIATEHARELVKRAPADVQEITKAPVAAPAPDPTKWPRVRRWLHEVRGMPTKLIDKLHSLGLVYADNRANATFKRTGGGAFQRGTGDTKFHRSIGGAECGPFIIPGTGKKVVLVEAPLDAIAAIAMHPDVIAIASGGDQLPPSKLAPWIPEGAEVLAGYDADRRGDQVAAQAAEQFHAKRLKPSRKDWSETVKNEAWRVNQVWDEPETPLTGKNAPRPVLRPN